MSAHIIKIADDFWNIRGDFKIAGFLNIGTQASLVKRANGKFLLLDAYTLEGEAKEQAEAIINLHPFHTIHVQTMHEQYPNAKLYGTQRHIDKIPDLPWQPELAESDECAAIFADDLEFSMPAGVDFISSNEHLHFSSVLAYHGASRTIHSDDTLMYLRLPGLLGILKKPEISFHMTLPKTLERRPGAVKDFREWAEGLAAQWSDAENLCAAHSATLLGSENRSEAISERILSALQDVEKTLQAHERKYG